MHILNKVTIGTAHLKILLVKHDYNIVVISKYCDHFCDLITNFLQQVGSISLLGWMLLPHITAATAIFMQLFYTCLHTVLSLRFLQFSFSINEEDIIPTDATSVRLRSKDVSIVGYFYVRTVAKCYREGNVQHA